MTESGKEVLTCPKDWIALLEKVRGADALQLINSAKLSVANVVRVEKMHTQV